MKVFERDGKINFVDEQNRFVGFDARQQCCESFGWFVSSNLPGATTKVDLGKNQSKAILEDYVFDPESAPISGVIPRKGGEDAATHFVAFRLVSKMGQRNPLYLCLVNSHNGYYTHGIKTKGLRGDKAMRI